MTQTPRKPDGLLSIAIPVYNFGAFLPKTLDSILPEAQACDVEVLVFDGGSTDDTPRILRDYRTRYTNLRYVRALSKGGIDADMARCVDLASASYCWLFSGDDTMISGSIPRVLEIAARDRPDLILARHNECHFDMSLLKDWPVLSLGGDSVFDLHDTVDRRRYFEAAASSEAFFSFMGGLIVRRRRWFAGSLSARFKGTNWAHIGRLWSLLDAPFRLYYLHEVALNRRGGNDSFSREGMLARLDIQINGLLDVIEGIFGRDSLEASHMRRVITGEVEPHWAAAVRQNLVEQKAPEADFARLDRMLARLKV